MEYRNPNDAWKPSDPNQYVEKEDADRQAVIIKRILKLLIALVVTLLILFVFCGCTTPRAVEEHHHHHYEADTAAVSRQVDAHLTSWRQQMDSSWNERISQYLSQQQQTEQQHETITETVTETVDSLGRKIRQEQRTISRDITRELQTIEQHITREYEMRLRNVTDSLDSTWQQRYDSLSARVVSIDSTSVKKTPVAEDNRPWYKRLWDHIQWLVIGIVIAAAVYLTRRWWSKIIRI